MTSSEGSEKKETNINEYYSSVNLPEGEKYFGFENPSASICYANSAV